MTLLLALCLHFSHAIAGDPISYTDTNSVQALRNLEKICAKKPGELPEPELVEWVRARFAWIALLRLEGKEKEAVKVFAGCESYCAKHGPSNEWKSLKSWGCAKYKRALSCK